VVVLQLSELVLERDVLVDREILADSRLLDENGDAREVFESRV